uniref:PKD domain-containing protein n=1 Tax=candidate division WOR-3 bacterium TaxID=2052148 RepID=A0A7C4CC84_UNCW3
MMRILLSGLLLVLVGCFNAPPSVPVLVGPDSAGRGDTVWFNVRSVDPEDGQISYMMDWGDTTADVWSYFFWSGDTVQRSHSYDSPGFFQVRCRARDIDGRQSDWSDVHSLRITP